MLVDRKLLDEIDMKYGLLESNPDFYLKLNSRAIANLDKYSKVYSWWIEHPDIRKGVLDEELNAQQKGELISIARQGIERLKDAWKYLRRIDDPLNHLCLVHLSKLVTPEENFQVAYREGRVSLGLQFTPPNPLRVKERLEEAFAELRAEYMHPVEKAVKAHLYLAGIQPFNNGNKRIARLIQDKILHNSGLPPAVIHPGERKTYIDFLENGLVGWRDSKPILQKGFFDYVAGKVNMALDEMIGDLNIGVNEKRLKQIRNRNRKNSLIDSIIHSGR